MTRIIQMNNHRNEINNPPVHLTRESIEQDGFFEERSPLQRSSTSYEVQNCVYAGRTTYADTVIVQNPDYGSMLFLDRELQSSSHDEHIYHETLVHPVMRALNHIDDKRVLVVGGAEGATVREVLRWGPNKVQHTDWVDIDPVLVNVCREHLRYAGPDVYENQRVQYHAEDIFRYLENPTILPYDIIILDLPDPDPEEPHLYGERFWTAIRRVLRSGGGLVSHVGPVEPGQFSGLNMVVQGARLGHGTPYHTFIPSFQGEWGFWMNLNPPTQGRFPRECTVMDDAYHATIMHWDRHWRVLNN